MNKLSFILIVSILTLTVSCNSKEDSYKEVQYQAVSGNDTAVMALKMSDKRFYGRYEISYYKFGKDSGDVRGDIKGDTLRGDFHYISNGGSWKRIPLALLKKDNKLVQGTGIVGTYMSLPCFLPGTLTYKEPKFTFEEMK
ncbi:hypothetical protein [Flavobacterium gelatinilyticum]|uniref:hypothetical protein n=1 Tax=Flavobacterium gelatinilyticum TaxID=3003260 RepID=UPI00247FB6EB|nr:hypothetical protein [Flavobacterium gelatinilyticum]